MNSAKLKLSQIYTTSIIWALLPILMMVLFWFKIIYSLPLTILGIYAVYKVVRKIISNSEGEYISLDWQVITVLLLIPIWMILVGIGGFFLQEQWDNGFRNAVLEVLVRQPWPVVNITATGFSYLNYYFAYWLPAAFIGKIFSSYEASQIALYLYSYLGLSLTSLMVMHICKRRYLIVGVLLFLFNGCDILSSIILRFILKWYDGSFVAAYIIGDPSVLYLCRFIYNQGIPAMVILMLMYVNKAHADMLLFFFAPLFCMAPLISLPLAPIIGYALLKNFKCSITAENVYGFLSCLLISIIFCGNSQGTTLHTVFQSGFPAYQIIVFILVWFIFSIGIFLPFIWKETAHDKIFWWLIITTIICSLPVPPNGMFDYGWKCTTAISLYVMLKVLRKVASLGWPLSDLKSKLFIAVIAIGVMSNCFIYKSMIDQYILYFQGHRDDVGRSKILIGKIFDNDTRCYYNFVTDKETIYSLYFMPRQEKIEVYEE